MPNSVNPTPNQQIPVPTDAMDPDVPGDVYALATFIEKQLIGIYVDVTDRDTRNTAGGSYTAPKEGQVAFTKDTDTFWVFDGTEWQQMYISYDYVPQITSGTAAPSGGSNGDIYFQV